MDFDDSRFNNYCATDFMSLVVNQMSDEELRAYGDCLRTSLDYEEKINKYELEQRRAIKNASN